MIDRIRERDGFLRLRREGVRVRSAPMWCSFVIDPAVSPPQVAFAIGRPVGNAVTRNRVRRRMRAVLAASDVPDGVYLFGGQPPLGELTFDDIQRRVTTLLDAVRAQRVSA